MLAWRKSRRGAVARAVPVAAIWDVHVQIMLPTPGAATNTPRCDTRSTISSSPVCCEATGACGRSQVEGTGSTLHPRMAAEAAATVTRVRSPPSASICGCSVKAARRRDCERDGPNPSDHANVPMTAWCTGQSLLHPPGTTRVSDMARTMPAAGELDYPFQPGRGPRYARRRSQVRERACRKGPLCCDSSDGRAADL